MTDVFISEKERGRGLGTWMIECINEILGEMGDHFRGAMLFAREGQVEEYYKKKLGMKRVEVEDRGLVVMLKSGPGEVENSQH